MKTKNEGLTASERTPLLLVFWLPRSQPDRIGSLAGVPKPPQTRSPPGSIHPDDEQAALERHKRRQLLPLLPDATFASSLSGHVTVDHRRRYRLVELVAAVSKLLTGSRAAAASA
jgi:hypothetical protein